MNLPATVIRLGQVEYASALRLQRRLMAARQSDSIDDHLLLLSHPEVVTLGRPSSRRYLKVSEETLKRRGVDVVEAGRGGEITFHGPGQIVVYPILKLQGPERDLHQHLRRLEQLGLEVCRCFGIKGKTIPSKTGVWVGDAKIAAIGVRASSWVTYHGIAINRTKNLEGFDWMVPCGLDGTRATSLESLLGRQPASEDVENAVIEAFSSIFARTVSEKPAAPLLRELQESSAKEELSNA